MWGRRTVGGFSGAGGGGGRAGSRASSRSVGGVFFFRGGGGGRGERGGGGGGAVSRMDRIAFWGGEGGGPGRAHPWGGGGPPVRRDPCSGVMFCLLGGERGWRRRTRGGVFGKRFSRPPAAPRRSRVPHNRRGAPRRSRLVHNRRAAPRRNRLAHNRPAARRRSHHRREDHTIVPIVRHRPRFTDIDCPSHMIDRRRRRRVHDTPRDDDGRHRIIDVRVVVVDPCRTIVAASERGRGGQHQRRKRDNKLHGSLPIQVLDHSALENEPSLTEFPRNPAMPHPATGNRAR